MNQNASSETKARRRDIPGDDVRPLDRYERARLLGKRIPVWSYLHRKFAKWLNRCCARWRLVRRPSMIRLRGVRVEIDQRLFSDKIIDRLYDGGYEREESVALDRTLRRDDRVLELGTGIGYTSTVAAKRVGSSRVLTVEANEGLAPTINKTYRLNNVSPTLVIGLMGDQAEPGSRHFYTHTRHLWSSSLHKLDSNYTRVEVTSLSWSKELDRFQPSYLVMDIEGGEIELLRDFDHPSVRRMLVEFHPRKSGSELVDEVFDHLSNIGFGVERVAGGTNVFYFQR